MDFQSTLFEAGTSLVPLRPERRVLGRGAWVDVQRGWLPEADAVFASLVSAVPWRAERRQMYDRVVDVPRLLCFYGENEDLPLPILDEARDSLSEHY
ncbi:MAG TPA: alpha-ketoglutarate-dependent dioxygenase AlkB, partial [Nocardioides sp.]